MKKQKQDSETLWTFICLALPACAWAVTQVSINQLLETGATQSTRNRERKDFVESHNDARHVFRGAVTRAVEARCFEVANHISNKLGLVGYVQKIGHAQACQ